MVATAAPAEVVSAQDFREDEVVRLRLALHDAESMFAAAFYAAPTGKILFDQRSGEVLDVNDAFLDLAGYAREEVVGRPISDIHLGDLPANEAAIRAALARDGAVRHHEVQIQARDGTRRFVLSSMAQVEHNGRPAVLRIVQDITPRRQAEDELRRANARLQDTVEELRQANTRLEEAHAQLQATAQHQVAQERLRALGQMAGGIAHDLNNALAPVLGFADLLRSEPALLDNRSRTLHYLELITTGARDAAETVRRLREFYRPRDETDVFALVDVNAVAGQVAALTRPRWRDEARRDGRVIALATDLRATRALLGSDAALREALTNLVFNAVDALPSGGTISLRSFDVPGGEVVLEVADTGMGMANQVRRRCLDPFFTTKGERGTGLGLAMVHGIVERHGGVLEIKSASGKGTTVRMTFPAAPDAPAQHTQRRVAGGGTAGGDIGGGPSPSGAAHRLLVVDDEPAVRMVTCALLAADGHQAVQAENGEAALRELSGAHFDAVLTDQSMPGLTGTQLAHLVKQRAPGTPVVLLTGYGSLMAPGDAGPDVDAVLAKPVTRRALQSALGALLAPAGDTATATATA